MKISKIASLIITIFFVSCSMSKAAPRPEFKLFSTNIEQGATINNKHVFNGFGCAGKNLSPQLSWAGAPLGTKGYALTVYDPDAPTGSGWWHWVLINIPANYTSLPINFGEKNQFKLEDNITQVKNDFGNFNFGGPCPPKGDKPHRYIFTIHALRIDNLELQDSATAAMAGYMINQSTIGKASFTAFFAR